jgi:enterochelin esterase family protein
MKSDWWYYASPGVEPGKPAALMVWQDGQGFAMRNSPSRLFTVTENLVHQGKIPPMVHLLIAPGFVGDERMRSIEYDTVSDRYTRFVLEEILPLLEKSQKIRRDAYSRAIGGQSSGGICSFTAAWLLPDSFSRVLSRVGSFTAIAWRSKDMRGDDVLDGGHFYPSMVRKEKKRNIRVWMEDGSEDLENDHGSWPLQNIQLANSLKMREYDFRFVFGNAQHNTAHGDSRLPEALAWLWRDYDPALTEQAFTMDPDEAGKPYFRVARLNRHE